MIRFEKENLNWSFERSPGPGTLHLIGFETRGADLEELETNMVLFVEDDWHNPIEFEFGALPRKIFEDLLEMIEERLRDEGDARAEALTDLTEEEQ